MSETLGYDFDVPYIMLHAITHDPESFPRPCLYCQLDEDEDGPSEVYLVPPREEDRELEPIIFFKFLISLFAVQTLFDAFSHAAMLNPDPNFEG
jgi:chloride channel, nucleotide-sensitive, 1A